MRINPRSFFSAIIAITAMVGLLASQTSASQTLSARKAAASFCDNYLFGNSITDIRLRDGKWLPGESGLWNEYDPNGEDNPVPDTIVINTYILNYTITFGDDSPSKIAKSQPAIYCTVKLQLKLSEDYDCLSPKNPVLSKEYILVNKKIIKPADFASTKPSDYTVVLESRVGIRQLMKTNIATMKALLNKRNLYLNQLIIRTYIEPANNDKRNVCYTEYIHPICAKVERPSPTR